MKGGKTPLGYTIVEVMIVLAISTAMFAMAARFVNGKQAKTAFNEGVNNFASQIQSVINQVNDGEYSDVFVTCTGGNGIISIPSAGTDQGINSPCVFLGKFLHFSIDRSSFDTFSVASSRLNSQGNPPFSPADGGAIPVTALTTVRQIPQNLSISSVSSRIGVNTYGSFYIGFLQQAGFTGQPQRGAQSVGLYYINGVTTPNLSTTLAVLPVRGSNMSAADSAKICVTDGDRKAAILIGTDDGTTKNNNPTTVKVEMGTSTPC